MFNSRRRHLEALSIIFFTEDNKFIVKHTFTKNSRGLCWLPRLVPGPVSLPSMESVSLGMIDVLVALSRQVLLMVQPIPPWFQAQQLQDSFLLSSAHTQDISFQLLYKKTREKD